MEVVTGSAYLIAQEVVGQFLCLLQQWATNQSKQTQSQIIWSSQSHWKHVSHVLESAVGTRDDWRWLHLGDGGWVQDCSVWSRLMEEEKHKSTPEPRAAFPLWLEGLTTVKLIE